MLSRLSLYRRRQPATFERQGKLVTCSSYDLSVPMYRNQPQEESIRLEDLISVIIPAVVATRECWLTAEDSIFTATASKSFCLYSRLLPI